MRQGLDEGELRSELSRILRVRPEDEAAMAEEPPAENGEAPRSGSQRAAG